jgi:hypothetical protein
MGGKIRVLLSDCDTMAGFELKETQNIKTGHGCGGKDLKSIFCVNSINQILASLCRRAQQLSQ